MQVKPLAFSPSSPPSCAYDQFSPNPVRAQIGTGYPFSMGIPCFVFIAQFDGRLFASDGEVGWNAAEVSARQFGTMTLITPDRARYVAGDGTVVTFHPVAWVRQPGCE
jgi:hypothetical protein